MRKQFCNSCCEEVDVVNGACSLCGEHIKDNALRNKILKISLVVLLIVGSLRFVIALSEPAQSAWRDPVSMQLVDEGGCPTELRSFISSNLKDPSSFRCEDVRGVRNEDGSMTGVVIYTATNSFNARVKGTCSFEISKNGEIKATIRN